ncbi:hypothetical protein Tco_0919809 [Tanacetum coccineum]
MIRLAILFVTLREDVTNQVNLEEKTVELDQDQAGPDPSESLESRPQPKQVHIDEDQARPDLGISRVALARPDPEPTHDEFMADLYPKVQESLKFSADEHVILVDPLIPTGTLSSMKNLEDEYAIGDQFINDKSTEDELGKLDMEAEVVSMVIVPIYQTSFSVPPLSTPIINLSPPKPASSTTQTPIFTSTTTTTTTPLPTPPQQQSTTESELAECVITLEKKLSDLEQNNKNLDNTSQNLGSRVYTLEIRDLPHKINEVIRENVKEAVQIALQAPLRDRFRDLSEEDRDKFLTEKDKSPKLLSHQHGRSLTLELLLQAPPSNNPVLMLSNQSTTYQYKILTTYLIQRTLTPPILQILSRGQNATTYQALAENSLLEKTGDMRTFMNWYCQKMGKTELTQADLEDQIDWANPEGDQVRIDISKPLPLSGPPGHVTIQTQFFFNKDLDYLRYGSKGSGQALSISKMKAARYHDFGLELLIPKHMWIDDVVKTDMLILSVVRIKSYSRYGYDYLKEITLRRAGHQEYTIAEKDFKNLYPSDFEDLNLLLLQGHLNHLPGSDIRFEFKHDYTIIDSPRVVVLPVNNNERKIMRFNEIYMFSDGTLTNIMEALDYRVKEYKVNWLNPSMNTRFWTNKDVERSKEFIHAIEQKLKTRRIIRNLECFVYVFGGSVSSRTKNEHLSDTYAFTMKMEILLEPTSNKLMVGKLGDSDVYTLEDLTFILEILSRRLFLRLNLPDHRSVLTGSGGSSKDGDGDTLFQ